MTDPPPVIDYQPPPKHNARRAGSAVPRFGIGAMIGIAIIVLG